MTDAPTPSDAFLSGEGIPVPLGRIEDELAKLWGPAAEREGGPDLDRPTVTRLVLANLVVADLEEDSSRVRGLVEGISRQYPCRLIVLRRSTESGRAVTAEVSAVCHLPAPGMPQVCAERIVLRAASEALDLLPGAVRPLLETDLPLVLWWAGDPRPAEGLFRDLADESSRLVIDQPDPQPDAGAVTLALDPQVNPYSRELAWFGITAWREVVAAFFDPPGAEEALRELESVRIDAVAAADGATPRVALWLAAWLAGRLGWKAGTRREESGRVVGASFTRPDGGPVEVAFGVRTNPRCELPHVAWVALDAGAAGRYQAERVPGESDVLLMIDAPGRAPLPRTVSVPEWDANRRLAGALESAREDPPYREARPHLLWLLGAPPV
jgi:glucose-6-phosphate dehydrogenase assembly protein OpcA